MQKFRNHQRFLQPTANHQPDQWCRYWATLLSRLDSALPLAALSAWAMGLFFTLYSRAGLNNSGQDSTVKGAAISSNEDDPLSVAMEEALATGVAKGVELAYSLNPEATEQAVQALVWLDGFVDAKVTYLDEATGQYVSKAWNSLDCRVMVFT